MQHLRLKKEAVGHLPPLLGVLADTGRWHSSASLHPIDMRPPAAAERAVGVVSGGTASGEKAGGCATEELSGFVSFAAPRLAGSLITVSNNDFVLVRYCKKKK